MGLNDIEIGSARLLCTLSYEPPKDMDFNQAIGVPETSPEVSGIENPTAQLNMAGFTP